MQKRKINNIVVVSDLHCGCRLGLCTAKKVKLDDGGYYVPSKIQRKLNEYWNYFWDVWVPKHCNNEPYTVVINGDVIDGVHHNSTTQISHNIKDQMRVAVALLEPIVEKCQGRFYMVRGTNVHVGESGVNEETIAEELKAIPNEDGQFARWELWIRVNKGLCHLMHHIGTTGSAHYESTAILKELVESYVEAGRNNLEPPDVVARSHRHRYAEVRLPTDTGYGISFTTPGWQLKTPFAYKIPGGRVTTPQIGGSLIRQGDEELHTRHFVKHIKRTKEVIA